MHLQIYFDGAARPNPGRAAAAALLLDKDGNTVTHRGEYLGITTNNVAEWTGLLLGLRAAVELGATSVMVFGDSQLVINQAFGSWSISEKFSAFKAEVDELVTKVAVIHSEQIPRERNGSADALCNAVLDRCYTPFMAAAETPAHDLLERVDFTYALHVTVSAQMHETTAARNALKGCIKESVQQALPLAEITLERLC